MAKRTLVLGSSNIDFILKITRFHNPGETILGENLETTFGGKGANQAVACRRLGTAVNFITKLGEDPYGKSYRQYLTENDLNPDFLLVDPKAPTGIAVIEVTPDGENRIIVSPGANGNLLPEDLNPDSVVWQEIGIFVAQLEVPLDTIKKALEIAKGAGAVTLLNPAPPRPLTPEALSLIDYLVPNETEAQILTGCEIKEDKDLPRIADKLMEMGPENIIITLGEKGAFFKNRKQEIWVRAFEVKPVDSTAAGDAFIGSLALGITEAKPIADILKFANAAGALTTTKLGAQPSLPSRNEVERFLKKTKQL